MSKENRKSWRQLFYRREGIYFLLGLLGIWYAFSAFGWHSN